MTKIHPAIAEHAMEEDEKLREALRWYEEKVAECRKIGSLGDNARQALDLDGGFRARDALSQQAEPAPAQDDQEVAAVIGFYEGEREPRLLSWNVLPNGEHRLYTRPAQAEQSRWISVEDRLPPVRQILSDSCVLEGKEIPALYRSAAVICFDGKRVCCQVVEWFHGQMPLSGVTHWMPLPAAPAQGGQ